MRTLPPGRWRAKTPARRGSGSAIGRPIWPPSKARSVPARAVAGAAGRSGPVWRRRRRSSSWRGRSDRSLRPSRTRGGPPRPSPLSRRRRRSPRSKGVEGSRRRPSVSDGARRLGAGDTVASGARLQVPPGGGMRLALDTGTRLDLTGGTTARVVELGAVQKFDLAAGSLIAQVVKLGPGRRFIIATPDSEVEVKGTRFEVSVGPEPSRCGPSVRTRVTVYEGVVAVRHAATVVELEAGRHWPDCQPLQPPAPRPRHSRAAPAPGRVRSAGVTRPAATPETARASTLAEQNDSVRRRAGSQPPRRPRRSHTLARSADCPLSDRSADGQRACGASPSERGPAARVTERLRSPRLVTMFLAVAGLLACDGSFRFDEPAGDAGWRTEACDGGSCPLNCPAATTCVGTCGASCSTKCEENSRCTPHRWPERQRRMRAGRDLRARAGSERQRRLRNGRHLQGGLLRRVLPQLPAGRHL